MDTNINELKEQVNLAELVAMDLGPPKKQRQRWWWWCCPFHDDRNPSFGVTPDNGRWKCFGCGEVGDHIDWLERSRKISTGEAIKELKRLAGQPETMRTPRAIKTATMPDDGPPPGPWQEAGRAFLVWAQEQLWTEAGKPGLDYLRGGGLTDETIRSWHLGWNPTNLRCDPSRWGLEGDSVWLHRGVVIPCEVTGVLWYIKIRQFDGQGKPEKQAGRKYRGPRHGRGALFGADRLRGNGRPLLLCEGERDAMLAHQEVSDIVDVASLGGAGKQLAGRWLFWVLPYRKILTAYDADSAGRTGANRLAELLPRVQVVRFPYGNDLTDFHTAGGDLRVWLSCHVEEVKSPADLEAELFDLMREDPQTPEEQMAYCKRYAFWAARAGWPCTDPPSWKDWLAKLEANYASREGRKAAA